MSSSLCNYCHLFEPEPTKTIKGRCYDRATKKQLSVLAYPSVCDRFEDRNEEKIWKFKLKEFKGD